MKRKRQRKHVYVRELKGASTLLHRLKQLRTEDAIVLEEEGVVARQHR